MNQVRYLFQWLVDRGLNLILWLNFYFLISPIAYLLSLLNLDIAEQNYQKETDSYWRIRTNKLIDKKYMRSQR